MVRELISHMGFLPKLFHSGPSHEGLESLEIADPVARILLTRGQPKLLKTLFHPPRKHPRHERCNIIRGRTGYLI